MLKGYLTIYFIKSGSSFLYWTLSFLWDSPNNKSDWYSKVRRSTQVMALLCLSLSTGHWTRPAGRSPQVVSLIWIWWKSRVSSIHTRMYSSCQVLVGVLGSFPKIWECYVPPVNTRIDYLSLRPAVHRCRRCVSAASREPILPLCTSYTLHGPACVSIHTADTDRYIFPRRCCLLERLANPTILAGISVGSRWSTCISVWCSYGYSRTDSFEEHQWPGEGHSWGLWASDPQLSFCCRRE